MLKSKGFYRGVNLGGWLSQCDYSRERLDNFIAETDFAKISVWGLDHVRIPIDYNVLENEDGTYKADGFARIDWALEMCRKYKLKTVIDLHKTAGFSFDNGEKEAGFFDSAELQERFYRLWEEIAKHYGAMTNDVVFELLNEVTDGCYITKWNQIAETCIRRIRAFAPDIMILVGSYHNNSVLTVNALDAPYDENVIYNFHCYEPLKFTHQGAYWAAELNPDDRFAFEECGIDTDYFEGLFADALAAAKKYNTTLYCGEYGMIDRVCPEDTLKWYKTIHAVFEKYGIARSAWSYKEMDFGLSDERLDDVRSELLQYL